MSGSAHKMHFKKCFGSFLAITVLLLALFTPPTILAQNKSSSETNQTDEELLNQYIQSKGANIILFKPSNIKQFWVDKSVVARKDAFEVLLEKTKVFESVPLHFQLANVNETQDCTIEVITETSNTHFSVLDSKTKTISDSSETDNFIQYKVLSSTFHMEDTQGLKFQIKFTSEANDLISIKAILLSFSQNPESHFYSSPGVKRITKNDLTSHPNMTINPDGSLLINDLYRLFSPLTYFMVSNNPISISGTFKNVGETPLSVYLRFAFYTKDHIELGREHFPCNEQSKVLKVISAKEGSDKIIVDGYSSWEKGSYIALNAREDYSDIPNLSLLKEKIIEVKKNSDDNAEIILDKTLSQEIATGTTIRIHGPYYHSGPQTLANRLQPGEEKQLSFSIGRATNFYLYSSKAIPNQVYYVKPIIISASNEKHSIVIRDINISY